MHSLRVMLAPMRSLLSATLAFALASCASHATRSVALYEHGDYTGAAQAADDGLITRPDDAGLWGMRVRSALALGDAEGVARAYTAYTARRGGDDPELLRDLAEATIEQALTSPSVRLKILAIAAVEELQINDLAESVAQAMGDADDRVQAAAAVAVLHGFAQAPQVAAEMLHSENAEARRIALEGVAKKIGKLAIADIEKGAVDPDPRVRAIAVRWLGQYNDRDAVEVCTKRLHDPDESVRAAAALALAKIGLGDLAAVAKLALADRALVVRLAGVAVLTMMKDGAQLAALADDASPMIALEAAIAVKQTHPELARQAIAKAVAADDWTVRAGAANSLARALDKEGVLATGKRLSTDRELGVRLAAARALAHAGDVDDAVAVFTAALASDRGIDAAADLGALGDPRGLASLADFARDPTRTAEQRAAAATAHRVAHRVTAGLVAALADSSGLVRVQAAATLDALAR